MNDEPPSDKKPRRRNAPRKRASAAKKAEVRAASPAAVPAKESAPAAKRANGRAGRPQKGGDRGAVPTPALDVPAALQEGSAAVSSIPAPVILPVGEAAVTPTPSASSTEPSERPVPVSAPPDVELPSASAPSGAPQDSAAATAPGTARLPSVQTPAAVPTQAAATTDPHRADAPIRRQDSLRPGELIRVPLSVRWRDLDAFNHVNNSKYLSYLEEARLRWMLSVPGMGLDDDVAPVVAASTLNYRRPVEWPGDVVIELFVERLGGSSLTIGHRIVDASDGGVLYCDGNVVMVWIDRTTGRSATLPEGVRAACR